MKLVSIVGARPQFIKAAVVSEAIRKHNDARPARLLREVLVHTGQHYDYEMSQVFFQQLPLPKIDHELGVGSGTHGVQTARVIEGVERILIAEQPDIVLVYGDTNTTLGASLAASKLQIPIAHVEAGLRSFNKRMPEEINRILTDHVSTWLFCPTAAAVRNLERESVTGRIELVGDVMHELLLEHAATLPLSPAIASHGLRPGGYILATVHRQENTDDAIRLKSIFDALNALSKTLPIVCPTHPRTRAALKRESIVVADAVLLIEPLAYFDMLAAQRDARLILTDSGGVQKEAFWLNVPCLTLRDETEWIETLDEGRNILVGADTGRIGAAAQAEIARRRTLPARVEFTGASGRLVQILAS
jgi:UDP-N-acetylglucosamine 2-epimerase